MASPNPPQTPPSHTSFLDFVRRRRPLPRSASQANGEGSFGAPADPPVPAPLAWRYSIRDAIGDLKVKTAKIANADTVPGDVGASLVGYATEREWRKLNPGQSSDKFFNLVRPAFDAPCPTITSAGVGVGDLYAPGGVASVTHPVEMRKFSIGELKRLSSFPDDFVLSGKYVAQWERIGNSVPPFMMRAVAEALRDQVLIPWQKAKNHHRKNDATRRPAQKDSLEQGLCK